MRLLRTQGACFPARLAQYSHGEAPPHTGGLYELLGERLYEAVAGLGRARRAADRLRSTRYTPPVRRALAGPQPPPTNTHPDR